MSSSFNLPETSRRGVLKGMLAGAVAGAPAAADAQVSIEKLFSDWQEIRDSDYANISQAECDKRHARYVKISDQIILATAKSERDFAIQYFVATDAGDSEPPAFFERKIWALVGAVFEEGSFQ